MVLPEAHQNNADQGRNSTLSDSTISETLRFLTIPGVKPLREVVVARKSL